MISDHLFDSKSRGLGLGELVLQGLVSLEEFLEPKSRPRPVGNEESRSTPPGSIYRSIDLDRVVIFYGKFS